MKNFNKVYAQLALYSALVVIIYGFYRIDNLIMSFLAVINVISVIYIYREKSLKFRFSTVDTAILLLTVAEITSYYTSVYKANSFAFLFELIFIVLLYFFIRFNINSVTQQILPIYSLIYYFGIVLSIATLLIFITHSFNISLNGFSDISQFRFMYRPLGFYSNDWSTVLLFFIAFSIVPFCFKKKKLLHLILFAVVLTASLTTFSRGAYLAIVAFFISLFILGYLNKAVGIKHIVLLNLFMLLIMTAFFSFFPQSVESTFIPQSSISHQRSVTGRIGLWKETTQIINQNNIIVGIGAKNFPLKNAALNQSSYFTSRVSNSYLQVLVEKGIFGFIAYVFFAIALLLQLKSLLKSSDELGRNISILFISLIVALIVRELTFSSVFENSSIMILGITTFATINIFYEKRKRIKNNNNLNRIWTVVVVSSLVIISSVLLIKNSNIKQAEKINDIVIDDNGITHKFKESINHIESALKLDGNNVIYYSELALLWERAINKKFDIQNIIIGDNDTSPITSNIKKANINLSKASKLNPDDACFYNNLGWLNLIINDLSTAEKHFMKAIKIEPNEAIYNISMGIYFEIQKRLDNAIQKYKKAAYLSPDILESLFFNDLQQRYPVKTNQLINENIAFLEEQLKVKNDVILKAKLAKFYSFNKQIEKSFQLFNEVVNELPNLRRPWLHLGDLYKLKGDSTRAVSMYKKAEFLNKKDFLPCLKLGNYYYKTQDKKYAAFYLTKALENWGNIKSEHSNRSTRIYGIKTYNNDIMPNGFLQYCKPYLDQKKVCICLSKLHSELGNNKLSEHYLALSRQ